MDPRNDDFPTIDSCKRIAEHVVKSQVPVPSVTAFKTWVNGITYHPARRQCWLEGGLTAVGMVHVGGSAFRSSRFTSVSNTPITQAPLAYSTECDRVTSCRINQHVSNNRCVDCPTGAARRAGDNPFGGNTVCEMCAANFRVQNNRCVACTGGATNQAGDQYHSFIWGNIAKRDGDAKREELMDRGNRFASLNDCKARVEYYVRNNESYRTWVHGFTYNIQTGQCYFEGEFWYQSDYYRTIGSCSTHQSVGWNHPMRCPVPGGRARSWFWQYHEPGGPSGARCSSNYDCRHIVWSDGFVNSRCVNGQCAMPDVAHQQLYLRDAFYRCVWADRRAPTGRGNDYRQCLCLDHACRDGGDGAGYGEEKRTYRTSKFHRTQLPIQRAPPEYTTECVD